MTKYIHDQIYYVVLFLQAAGMQPPDVQQLDKLRRSWFRNVLNKRSLRLTQEGFKWATRISDLDSYTHQLDQPLTPKNLLQLEHHITNPYFIRSTKVVKFFGERDSIMLSLHGDDLKNYMDQLDQHG